MRFESDQPQVKQAFVAETAVAAESLHGKTEKADRQPLARQIYQTWQGVPRLVRVGGDYYDYSESRILSLTHTPRMCINRYKIDIGSTDWEIVPLCEEGKDKPSDAAIEHARYIRDWLMYRPNGNGESFSQIQMKFTDDLLTHDAGVLLKTYAAGGNRGLLEIDARDSSLFSKEIDDYLRLGRLFRTVQQPNNQVIKNMRVGYWYNWNSSPKIAFEPHHVVYMMDNPRSDIPYGTSMMYVMKHMIYSLMYDEEFYQEIFEEYGGKVPGIISPDITTSSGAANILNDNEFKRYKEALKDQLNSYSGILAVPSKTQLTPLVDFRLIQWLETQQSYRQLIIALFNLTPAILGYTADVHKATDASQQSLYIEKGLRPRLNTIQWYMNTQVLADFFWEEDKERNVFAHGHKGKWAGQPMDVMFRFKLYDQIGDKLQLEIDEKKLRMGMCTLNDILRKRHEPSVAWGDVSPLFLYGVQPWGQSYGSGSMNASVFKLLTGGVEPAIKQIQEAIKPAVDGLKPEDDKDVAKKFVDAFNASRVCPGFDCYNVKAHSLPTELSLPREVSKQAPKEYKVS